MIKILKYLKKYKWSVVLVIFFIAVRGILELLLPNYMAKLLGQAMEDKTETSINGIGDFFKLFNSSEWQPIFITAGIMLVIIIFIIILTILSRYFESKVASGFAMELRREVYKKVESFSLDEMDYFTVSSLITRTTNDIQQLQGYVNFILGFLFLQPIMAIGAIVMAIRINASLSLVLTVSLVSLLIILITIFVIILPYFAKMQKLMDKMNLVTRENLTGLRVVRAHNTQKYQEEKIDKVNLETKKINIFVGRTAGFLWPTLGLVLGLTSLAIMFFGANHINFEARTGLNPEELLLLQQYSSRAIMSLMFITMIFIMIPRANVSANRIMEVLDLEPRIKEESNPVNLEFEKVRGEVIFNDVTFKYMDADEAVIKNISFKAEAGKTTAFIGSTGSGKSTLINLIPRFYDATEGEILIDNIPINKLSFNSLYSLIGYVPQQGILFSGTIRDNIAFGKNSNVETIEKSAEIAQGKEFIESFNDKYDSNISQGGTNVSGGQRQRLSIARAINKNPKIFIFDDSFSALDYNTDKKLRQALKDVEATKLIVAQRINTIIDADQIIVLNNGVIEGIGTHKELMKTSKVYQEIAYSQLSKEELEDE